MLVPREKSTGVGRRARPLREEHGRWEKSVGRRARALGEDHGRWRTMTFSSTELLLLPTVSFFNVYFFVRRMANERSLCVVSIQ